MQEWAAAATHAASILKVSADCHAVLARNVCLLLKLMIAVSEGAGVAILANSCLMPEFAKLCLLLDLVVRKAMLKLFVEF